MTGDHATAAGFAKFSLAGVEASQAGQRVDPRFADRLQELRRQRGLSLRRLGRSVHYSHTHLWDLETGKKRATEDVAAALDAALDAGGQLIALADAANAQSSRIRQRSRSRTFIPQTSPTGLATLTKGSSLA